MDTNLNVIGWNRLRIKPKSTAPEADAFTTRPSELSTNLLRGQKLCDSLAFLMKTECLSKYLKINEIRKDRSAPGGKVDVDNRIFFE